MEKMPRFVVCTQHACISVCVQQSNNAECVVSVTIFSSLFDPPEVFCVDFPFLPGNCDVAIDAFAFHRKRTHRKPVYRKYFAIYAK